MVEVNGEEVVFECEASRIRSKHLNRNVYRDARNGARDGRKQNFAPPELRSCRQKASEAGAIRTGAPDRHQTAECLTAIMRARLNGRLAEPDRLMLQVKPGLKLVR